MDYGDIFKRGFLITWNNKFLYLLGFLAALGGSGGGGGGGGSNFNTGGNFSSSPEDFSEFEDFFRGFGIEPSNLETLALGIAGAAIAVFCILAIIGIVLWFIRLIAEAGMIQAVADLESGVKTNFKKAFADGRPYMMKFFITKLIIYGIPIVLFILAFGAVGFSIAAATSNGNFDESIFAWFIPIFCLVCLFVPYNLVMSIVYPIAQRGMVFKGMEAMESIKYGWELLKEKTSDIIILALLFTVTGFVVGIVSAIVALPVLIGAGWPVFSAFMSGEVPSGGQFTLLGIGVLLMIIVGAIVNSIFISFRSASFTLAYLQLDGKEMQLDLE